MHLLWAGLVLLTTEPALASATRGHGWLNTTEVVGQPLPEVDLDHGPWEFEADPLDVGVAEQWYSAVSKPHLARTIISPGAWQAQGVGNSTALMHHQYQGVGWYRKVLTVGAVPKGGSIWLWIGGAPGGVMRSANVWANGLHCGRHVGYLEPLEIELTPALSHTDGGDLVLAVAVDSRWNRTEDPLWGGGSMWNYGWDGYNFGGYGGMIGNAKLLIRQPAWIEDSVNVGCKDAGSASWQCTVKFRVAGRVSDVEHVSIAICEWGNGSGKGCIRGQPTAVNAPDMALTLTIPNAKLWVPGTQAAQAALYVANLTLSVGGSDANATTTRSTRFGVRSLDTNGPRILFNGEPLFLRGYGDDGQYGFTGAPPMDKDFYRTQLEDMKKLGFNFIRFHTHSMPDVFHEAADELGFLCNPEFAMSYQVGCPFPGCVYNADVHAIYNRSFASIVHRRSHHPSVFGWVLSNEIGFSTIPFAELYTFAKHYDPDRPCWFADGTTPIAGMNLTALACRNGLVDTDESCFMDVWVPCSNWGKTPYAPPYLVPELIGSGVPEDELPVPMLLHEAFDARTFPRLESNLQAFEGGMLKAGAWLNSSIDHMRSLGLLEENDDWALASEKRYNLHMKTYLESYRLDPAVSGYEWWLGFDWIAASNGLIAGHANNPRAKPGIDNATLRNVQNEVVLLLKDPVAFQATGRRPGEFIPIEVFLANWTFMGSPQWFGRSARLSWAAGVVGGPTIGDGASSISEVMIAQGEIGAIAAFGVTVPSVTTATTIVVNVTLDISGDCVASNKWTLSVFPETVAKECPVPVFATLELLHAAQQVCSNALEVPSSLAAQNIPFVLLRHGGMSSEDVASISRTGGFAVSMNPGSGSWPVCGQSAVGSVELATVAFTQPWWISSGTTGTLVYNSSLTKLLGFSEAHNFLDYGWMSVVEGGQAYVLDGLAAASAGAVHIRAIPSSGSYATQLEYETTISNTALLWEGEIATGLGGSQNGEGGRFLVSGLNLFNTSSTTPWLVTEPIADFAFSQLLSYAVTETVAGRTNHLPAEDARSQQSVVVDAPETKTCNVSGSFCRAGLEKACQKQIPTNAGICNGNCEIITAVCLQEDAVLDALYPRLLARTNGSKMIGVVYSATTADNNRSFCPPPSSIAPVGPLQLVAAGAVVTLDPANGSTWLRLPMPPTKLKAGVYWIGALFESDITCFSIPVPASGNPPIGPGSADAYISRLFASGPLAQWTPAYGGGGFTVYATTRP